MLKHKRLFIRIPWIFCPMEYKVLSSKSAEKLYQARFVVTDLFLTFLRVQARTGKNGATKEFLAILKLQILFWVESELIVATKCRANDTDRGFIVIVLQRNE